MIYFLCIVIVFSSALSVAAYSETQIGSFSSQNEDFNLILVIDNLYHPWSLAFLPDGSALISERRGRLVHYRDGELAEITGLPRIPSGGQGGLLDLALHPQFAENSLLYFSHSADIGSGKGTAVSRGYFTGDRLINIERIFTSNKGSRGTIHYGSRLVFDESGRLYISLGERGTSSRAQDTDDHAGSVIRINDDGTVPQDNPFISGGGAAEIFTYGHRNPQGMAVDPLTGAVWSHEHGPKGGDEVNKLSSGSNYGWPLVTYGINYNNTIISPDTLAPGIEPPLLYWVPSIAPSGMTFYTGNSFSAWHNDIFAGALAGRHIRRIVRDGEKIIREEILLKDKVDRIRDIRTGPDGDLWFITDENNGGLYKLEPAE